MREHLYRAKREENGAWIYGDLLTPTDFMDIYEIAEKSGMGDRYDIDPDTICEYTGLKDKNGKKIFENDIVQDVDGRVYRIVFFEYEWIAEQTRTFWLNIKHLKSCSVIGNMYDNSELYLES